jgi:hypothetical protein
MRLQHLHRRRPRPRVAAVQQRQRLVQGGQRGCAGPLGPRSKLASSLEARRRLPEEAQRVRVVPCARRQQSSETLSYPVWR